MEKVIRKIISIILVFAITIRLIIISYAEEIYTSSREYDFIYDMSSGQNINEYEKEALDKINEIIESRESESNNIGEEETTNILESALDEVVNEERESANENSLNVYDIATKSNITKLQIST